MNYIIKIFGIHDLFVKHINTVWRFQPPFGFWEPVRLGGGEMYERYYSSEALCDIGPR